MFSLKVDNETELELIDEARVEESFAVIMANYEHIREWSPWLNEDLTLEKAREHCRKNMEEYAQGKDIGLRIIHRGKIVGSTGLSFINRRDRSAEIGCWIAQDQARKGLATKCVVKLLNYGFDELNLNRIVVKCAAENLKSQGVPRKLGFFQEGIEREGMWLQTRFVDSIVYSMLAKEWKK